MFMVGLGRSLFQKRRSDASDRLRWMLETFCSNLVRLASEHAPTGHEEHPALILARGNAPITS